MRAFGAELGGHPEPEEITVTSSRALMRRAAEIVDEVDGFATDQFNNRDMVEGYAELGRELLDQLDGRIDAFCSYVGTAGCFLGVTGALRSAIPDVYRVIVEPAESPVISGGEPGTHRIEGGGVGFWPPLPCRTTSTR